MHSKSFKIAIIATSVAAQSSLFALTVDVERLSDEHGLPWGYVDATGLRAGTETYSPEAFDKNLSAAPFVDYMVAMNGGAPGIIAEKDNGPYLNAEESTVAQLGSGGSGGANGGFAPDSLPTGSERFALMLQWSDGTPFTATTGWFGVSWGGWNNTLVEELELRVNLASDGPVNVVHWFNDGWLYSTDLDGREGNAHTVLDGHEFKVTHHAADGAIIAEIDNLLPSGGGSMALGKTGDFLIFQRDHRQFYTATITATRTAEGEYLMLQHRAGNMGYRATAVTLGNDRPWAVGQGFSLIAGEWMTDPLLGSIYGYSTEWGYATALGSVHTGLMPHAIYASDIGWLFAPQGTIEDGLFLYRASSESWIWLKGSIPGFYFDFATGEWISIS